MHKIGSRLQAVDCLLRHHLRRANRQEAALNAEYAPRSEADGADALHRDGKRRVDERLLHSLEVVAICESEKKKRIECRRQVRVRACAGSIFSRARWIAQSVAWMSSTSEESTSKPGNDKGAMLVSRA